MSSGGYPGLLPRVPRMLPWKAGDVEGDTSVRRWEVGGRGPGAGAGWAAGELGRFVRVWRRGWVGGWDFLFGLVVEDGVARCLGETGGLEGGWENLKRG